VETFKFAELDDSTCEDSPNQRHLLCILYTRTDKRGIDLQVCEKVYLVIKEAFDTEAGVLIRKYANEGRITQRDCWCELQHAATRFHSYFRAVDTLYSAFAQWPELFEAFKVKSVPSSLPWPKVMRNCYGPEGLTAEAVIGRMTSDEETQKQAWADAEQLQRLDLDGLLKKETRGLSPIVHAEVLIHQSLEKDDLIWDPSKFFGGYRYIGTSKGTCRLCSCYFYVRGGGVKVRPSHGNLYSGWRVPDVYDKLAAGEAEKLMTKILESIRGEVFDTLAQKVSRRSKHDSNSEPTYPTFQVAEPNGLGVSLNRLQIVDEDLEEDAGEAKLG